MKDDTRSTTMQSTKREAEDFARVNHGGSSKKTKFDVRNPSALAPDALEDDAILDADVIGSRGQQVKRGAVNVDGYDSDSDNENFDSRAAAKAKAQDDAAKSKLEEENDMFADLEEDFKDGDDSEGDGTRKGGIQKKKDVRFLDADEIQGEVKNSKSGGHVSADFTLSGKGKTTEDVESSSDSEIDDAERANAADMDKEIGAGGKKSHAPKLDAFNMRDEQEEGKFDEQGNYVRKAADPDSKYDVWMDGISKKDMKKAQDAHEKREHDRRQKAIEDDAKSDGDILGGLISILQPSETTLEALARLNPKKKKPKWLEKKKKDAAMDIEQDDQEHQVEEERKKTIERITECADLLLARGQAEIYNTEREMLMRAYQKSTGQVWTDETQQSSEWEYRWSDGRNGENVHGPYPADDMKAWFEAGYFGDGVEFRKIGMTDWNTVVDFV